MSSPWSLEDIKFFKNNYKDYSIEQLSLMLKKYPCEIKAKRNRYIIRESREKKFDLKLIQAYLEEGKSFTEMAKLFNTTRKSLTRFCEKVKFDWKKYHKKQFNIPKPFGDAAFNVLFRNYEHGAYSRNLEFLLTKEEFKTISSQNCVYCDSPPKNCQFSNSKKETYYIYNGIDRVDNSIGYLVSNCVACCGTCNGMKNDLSLSEFKSHITKIFNIFNIRKD